MMIPEWLWLGPTALVGVLVPMMPLAEATQLEPVGFADAPYADEAGYAQGAKPWALAAHGARQETQTEGTVTRAGARLRGAQRIGADLEWTRFSDGELREPRGADYWTSHVVGNLSEAANQVVDWGVGLATLRGENPLWGGSLEAGLEFFPLRPFSVHARYQLGVLSDRRAYHDLAASGGLVWGRFGVGAGWRAFLNPRRASHGPELTLRVWL